MKTPIKGDCGLLYLWFSPLIATMIA